MAGEGLLCFAILSRAAPQDVLRGAADEVLGVLKV